MLPNPAQPIYRFYESLFATLPPDPQAGLGGKLLYAGAIHPQSRNLLYAANIAGAASLASSADPVTLREAMRDGVIDFLVNSLEEALRILKNEIRKRQTVSVGVAADPHHLAGQMLERGVLPDLLPLGSWPESETGLDRNSFKEFLSQGARQVAVPDSEPGSAQFVTWTVDGKFARWLPRLDACAVSAIPSEDVFRQRWLRLAPRYLGRLAHRQHGVVLSAEEQARFGAEVEQLIERHKSESGEELTVTVS